MVLLILLGILAVAGVIATLVDVELHRSRGPCRPATTVIR